MRSSHHHHHHRSSSRLATLATERLASARANEERAQPCAKEEQATIDAMATAIRDAARQRRRRRTLTIAFASTASLLVAAAVIFLVLGKSSSSSSPASANHHDEASPPRVTVVARSLDVPGGNAASNGSIRIHGGREEALSPGASVHLQGGDRVIAKRHPIAIDLSTGTRLGLDPSTEMAVQDDLASTNQSFVLQSGRLRADVAKLAPNQRFMVRTADVEVEVRGTSFVVESGLAECAGSTTRVRVSEGVVVVRSVHGEARVTAGGAWPSGCEASASASKLAETPPSPQPPPPPQPTLTPPSAHTSASSNAKPPPIAAAAPPPAAPSELADQNRLYAEATAARRRGANAEAIRAYERFLARYPNGQLAESAAVERMRLLSVTSANTSLATNAARDYLSRYPQGFAREEAARMLAAAPASAPPPQ